MFRVLTIVLTLWSHLTAQGGNALSPHLARPLAEPGITASPATVKAIATDAPEPSREAILRLLKDAPAESHPALAEALRQRLSKNVSDGLAVLDAARPEPFSARNVCGGGSAGWKSRMTIAVTASHDIVTALQRADCLDAMQPRKAETPL